MYTYVSKKNVSPENLQLYDNGDYHPYDMDVTFKVLSVQQYEDYSDLKIEWKLVERDSDGIEVYSEDGNDLIGEYIVAFRAIVLARIKNKYIDDAVRDSEVLEAPIEGLETLECKITDFTCTSGDASLTAAQLEKLLEYDSIHEELDSVDILYKE